MWGATGVTSRARCLGDTTGPRAEGLASILAPTPQRRLIEPGEIAFVAAALCREESLGINGQAIGIDGGEFMG